MTIQIYQNNKLAEKCGAPNMRDALAK